MEKEEALAQFMSITGCSSDSAQFYMEAGNWDLETATSNFFESDQSRSAVRPNASAQETQPTPAAEPFRPPAGGDASAQPRREQPRVRTFRDLISGNTSDSDSDEGENYYAGGEKSGVMMQGGPKRDPASGNDLVRDIIEKASKAGPPPEEFVPGASKPSYFTGAGYRLGNEEETAGPSAPSVHAPRSAAEPEPVERHLIFWKDGFSIDDGELRRYDDPQNQEFLRAINSGRAPTHLLNVAYDQPVSIKVTRNMDQNYVAPPKTRKAFEGQGQRLGGIVSAGVEQIPGSFPGSSTQPSSAVANVPEVSVDTTQPVTTIQVRMADGSRLPIKLNHSHTVQDIRNAIIRQRPEASARSFTLSTSYPVKQLKEDETVAGANLVGSVVVMRWA